MASKLGAKDVEFQTTGVILHHTRQLSTSYLSIFWGALPRFPPKTQTKSVSGTSLNPCWQLVHVLLYLQHTGHIFRQESPVHYRANTTICTMGPQQLSRSTLVAHSAVITTLKQSTYYFQVKNHSALCHDPWMPPLYFQQLRTLSGIITKK